MNAVASTVRQSWRCAALLLPWLATLQPAMAQPGPPQLEAPPAAASAPVRPPLADAHDGARPRWLVPAVRLVGFDAALNVFDRTVLGGSDYDANPSSARRNLRRRWGVDRDSFTINQLGHPYQGSIYHGIGRSTGLSYWESSLLTFAGSAFWEIAGETTRPSVNDQVATGIGGSFLGEALFRMSHLWLERGVGSRAWREIGAALISPPVGFDRWATPGAAGNRLAGAFASGDPEVYSRLRLGAASTVESRLETPRGTQRREAFAEFLLDYGLPGKPGYHYGRPFDFFAFRAAASTAAGIEHIHTSGLLWGDAFGIGADRGHGLLGLFGSYDYLSPQVFRMASTGLSVGGLGEWRLAPRVALQGMATAGIGYVTVSRIGELDDETANNYGVAPQAALQGRLVAFDRASLDASARVFDVGRSGGGSGGRDRVARLEASLTWRVAGPHAVTLKVLSSRRGTRDPAGVDRTAERQTVGLFYTLLGRDRLAD